MAGTGGTSRVCEFLGRFVDARLAAARRLIRFVLALGVLWPAIAATPTSADDLESLLIADDDADAGEEKSGKRQRDQASDRQRLKLDYEIDENAPARRYSEGRLIITDFDMDPPEDRDNLDAMLATQVRIHFDYRCKYGRRYGGGAKAELTRLDVFAVVRPKDSWIATPDDRRLIDHEQGHFDIAQIAAISARLHMHEQWKAGKLKARADDSEAAIAKLRDNIQAEMQPFYAKLKKAQKQYDDVTSHGRRFRAQRDQRKVHDEFLKLLTKKWEESEWYKRRRKPRRPVLANLADGDKAGVKEDEKKTDDDKSDDSDSKS